MSFFDAFDTAVADLLFTHGLNLAEIHERSRHIAAAGSKDFPRLQILCCDSEGGYSYSSLFKSFVESKDGMPDSLATKCAFQYLPNQAYLRQRVRDVQWIVPFGRQVMEIWPMMGKMVTAYMRNHLGHRMRDIGEIAFHRGRLSDICQISEMISAESGEVDGKEEWNIWNLIENEDFSIYTPAALKSMCTKLEGEKSQLIVAIEEKRDAVLMHMTEPQYEAMLDSLGTKFPEEIEVTEQSSAKPKYVHKFVDEAVEITGEISKPWDKRVKRFKLTKNLSFIDAITHYHENHYAPWRCQSGFFDERAMRFLLLHPEYIDRLLLEGDNVDGTQRLGLCAASSSCCKLQIAEVPLLAEWKLTEINGREAIRLL